MKILGTLAVAACLTAAVVLVAVALEEPATRQARRALRCLRGGRR